MKVLRLTFPNRQYSYYFVYEISSGEIWQKVKDSSGGEYTYKGEKGFLFICSESSKMFLATLKKEDDRVLKERTQNELKKREFEALQKKRLEEWRKKDEQQRKEIYQRRLREIDTLTKYKDDAKSWKEIKRQLRYSEKVTDYEPTCDKLMQHQIAGAKIAAARKSFGFFFDTGTGKTLLGLEIINKKYTTNGDSFLIICPKTIINTAWLDDCDTFFKDMKILPVLSGMKAEDYEKVYLRWKNKGAIKNKKTEWYFERRNDINANDARKVLQQETQHYITNPEKFRIDYQKMADSESEIGPFYEYIINGIIFDESAIIRNRQSITFKALKKYALSIEYIYLMSGKPAPNTEVEYESQVAIIEPNLYSAWKDRGNLYNIGPKHYLPEDFNISRLELVNMVSMTLSKEDCLDLPETTQIVRSITLDRESLKTYNAVKYTTWQAIKDKTTDDIFFISGNFMKLRQVASGFLIETVDIKEKKIADIHDCKLQELMNVLDEMSDKQALIWCQFKYEIQKIEQLLKDRGKSVVTAYGDTKDKDRSIRDFKDGKAQYMIANPNTLKYGATLVNCTYAIYYSISYSFEEYYQSHDRIYRKGQTKPCTFIFLLAERTIDELMYKAIMQKQTKSKMAEEILKHLAKTST